MSVQPMLLTREGRLRLEQELDHLSTVRRRKVAERLHEALPGGGLLEDGELENALNEQAFLEGRIQTLEIILSNAAIIEDAESSDVVVPGSYVSVIDLEGDGTPEVYRVVGSAEADPAQGTISNESPLGKALMKRGVGDQVAVEAPGGNLVFKIVGIYPASAAQG